MKNIRKNRKSGQAMVEYIIIVVVVGVFCIGIFMALGKGVESQVGQATSKLVGSKDYDKKIVNTDTDTRVDKERNRKNLMTGE